MTSGDAIIDGRGRARRALRFGYSHPAGSGVWGLAEQAHCVVVGAAGSGRVAVLREVMAGAVAQGVEVVALDPHRVELVGVSGVGRVATGPEEMAEVVHAVHAELGHRYLVEGALGRRPVPLVLAVSDMTSLAAALDVGRGPGRRWRGWVDQIGGMGAGVNVHLLIGRTSTAGAFHWPVGPGGGWHEVRLSRRPAAGAVA